VWAEDEARFGLIPSYRRVWALRGHRPTASSRRKYQWRYLYCFVHPRTGAAVNVIGSSVSSEAMSEVLALFAREAGAGPSRRVIVVLDGAGWHTAKNLAIPEGVHLVFLPPYSPELQPAERVWPLINEAVANRAFPDMAALVDVIEARLRHLDRDRGAIRGRTAYHWWPADRMARNVRES
jgi:hypothetical protein